jgi:hypothetical protein
VKQVTRSQLGQMSGVRDELRSERFPVYRREEHQ